MVTKYYVNANGDYIGGFEGVEPPVGSFEVDAPPPHGKDRWDGTKWVEHVKSDKEKVSDELRKRNITFEARIEAIEKKLLGDSSDFDSIQAIIAASKT